MTLINPYFFNVFYITTLIIDRQWYDCLLGRGHDTRAKYTAALIDSFALIGARLDGQRADLQNSCEIGTLALTNPNPNPNHNLEGFVPEGHP